MITRRSPLHRTADTAVFWLCVVGYAIAMAAPYFSAVQVTQ